MSENTQKTLISIGNGYLILIFVLLAFSAVWGSDFYFIDKRFLLTLSVPILLGTVYLKDKVLKEEKELKEPWYVSWLYGAGFVILIAALLYTRYLDRFKTDPLVFYFLFVVFLLLFILLYVYFKKAK